jgi:hypothetical protein
MLNFVWKILSEWRIVLVAMSLKMENVKELRCVSNDTVQPYCSLFERVWAIDVSL